MMHKAAVLLLLLTHNLLAMPSSEVGSIATIERYNGEVLGPYIVKDFHSHDVDQVNAQPLTGEAEGSGDYSALYGDTEDDEDTGSGSLPIPHIVNNLAPHRDQSPKTVPEPPKTVPTKKEVSEWVFVADSVTSQTPSQPALITEQPSKPSTPAPVTTPEPAPASTPAPQRPVTLPSLSSAPPACHESCVALLEAVTLEVLPEDVSFVRQGEGVRMTCSVSVTDKEQEPLLEQIQLNWLFEGQMPLTSECSLDGQRYLAACEGFHSVWEEQQRNATHLKADILFTKLTVTNSGRYLCQAAAHCCGSLPQRQLQHTITVWQAAYTTQMAVMITASVLLTVLLVVTVYFKRRLERQRTSDYKKVLMVSSTADLSASNNKVLHLPLQQEDDYNNRDSFSSADSVYP